VGRTISPASKGKAPRTARGEKTLRKILDAALLEFGQRGFHDSSIVGITSRAKVALGTFYTYFDSKEAVFAALVRDMSRQVRDHVAHRPVTGPVDADLPHAPLANRGQQQRQPGEKAEQLRQEPRPRHRRSVPSWSTSSPHPGPR